MKKIITTIAAAVALTFGTFTVPAQASVEDTADCSVVEARLDALTDNFMRVWREAEAYKGRTEALTETFYEQRATITEQAATIEEQANKIKRQRALIRKLRNKR